VQWTVHSVQWTVHTVQWISGFGFIADCYIKPDSHAVKFILDGYEIVVV